MSALIGVAPAGGNSDSQGRGEFLFSNGWCLVAVVVMVVVVVARARARRQHFGGRGESSSKGTHCAEARGGGRRQGEGMT